MEAKRLFTDRMIKATVFIIVFYVFFINVSSILVNPEPNTKQRHYQWIRGFYKEPKDSLDAVFIGSSSVYSFWQAPIAWGKYRLKIYSFTSASQPLTETKTIIENLRRTQTRPLFIISTNIISGYNYNTLHYLIDYIPFKYKFKFVSDMAETEQISFQDTLEYHFPIIRFHGRWKNMSSEDFHYELEGLKGGSHYEDFLTTVVDVSDGINESFQHTTLDSNVVARITDLLDYCKKEKLNVLFVSSPWVGTQNEIEHIKAVNCLIEKEGFIVLDLIGCIDEIGLNKKEDYYNIRHTNIHGSLKVTDYIAKYLAENYTFPERSERKDESWNKAYKKYKDVIVPYLSEKEIGNLP